MIRAAVAALVLLIPAMADQQYRESVERWRADREAKLKAPDGWLSVAGLFWLEEGNNAAGSASGSRVLLPRGPAHLGDFVRHGSEIEFVPAAGAGTAKRLRPVDTPTPDDSITAAGMTMFLIQRGDRYAIRLRDPESDFRKSFTGLKWYPVREDCRVQAEYVPYGKPHTIAIANIIGQTDQEPSPGYLKFMLLGHQLRLDPILEDGRLFIVFRDATSGHETYGAGRFLYADLPSGHVDRPARVVLDFNEAYSPPCAFTPYATCPLPPPQNRLPVRIEAGELKYGNH